MTFSICVREPLDDGGMQFGVAVTTRLAGVGTLCPFVNEHGAVATQSLVNVDLGRRGIDYLADGIDIADALQGLLNADDGQEHRQLHGVDATNEFAYSGESCKDWFGHHRGDTYTVAGNLLVGESVITETAAAYEASRDDDRPLAFRLVDALEAGHSEGGDKRTDLHVHSAAIRVETTVAHDVEPFYNDIRVDATETPITDLHETLTYARESYEMVLDRYEDAYAEDDLAVAE